ncbi:outer membrane beta-barrel family protein [Flavobacterium crassostreae]|uniref:TonB-dependent receptor n=1 Tax=Flavobacterium crassostreae TaxID=1763534 RepID=A0A1B9E9P7_9FLAO|nr:outer membrane beta-barrel family protein [Flavobacterium crassostreae]OCB78665.1 TonB-dependent receptor [Flavobacterium crassostreae]
MPYSLKHQLSLALFFVFLFGFAQQKPAQKDITITGNVLEKTSKQPLEYATVTFTNSKTQKITAGGITNSKGEFSIVIAPGLYTLQIEFISFKPVLIKQFFKENTALGTLALIEDVSQLKEVVIRAEKSTVEIKLDKKVYHVGKDMLVKGGTVSDVLENVPSVSVDVEGNVSLRGSDNVRIFIDGRPSNALNMAEALRQIPADAIDKVEVITNPSARYDAEGGAGILNIILKKGKTDGFNGTLIGSLGLPETYGLNANLNYKTQKINYFTSTGYSYRTSQGAGTTNSQYLNPDNGSILKYINENRDTKRNRKGINTKTGAEWTLNPTTFWTNSWSYRQNNGTNQDQVTYNNLDQNNHFVYTNYRLNDGKNTGNDWEFASNFIKNFSKSGHKLTTDASYSKEKDLDNATINGINNHFVDQSTYSTTNNTETQNQFLLQADYVLPIKEGSQFEAGYKGNFNTLNKKYAVLSTENTFNTTNPLSNTLEYNEKINALYTQYGFKTNKVSYLFGLRWEDTNIAVNLLDTQEFNTKKYQLFFPSAFVNYQITDQSNLSISYSKRLSRPRGRYLDPTANLSSNINIFRGNPDLDPSLTDKLDLGYLQRWNKLSWNTSVYFENTTDVFSFVRYESGQFVGSTPVVLITPINLGKEQKTGFEFTLNYSPFKKWKINSSLNLYNTTTTGNFSYTNSNNQLIIQSLNNQAFSWFTRSSSRLSLPYKIEWQASIMYFGPSKTAQGKSLEQYVVHTAFSKDLLKEKATIAFNVSDVFNSRKMKNRTNLANLNSYSEFQWRKRQWNLSFTYRINNKKTDRDKTNPKNNEEEGSGF